MNKAYITFSTSESETREILRDMRQISWVVVDEKGKVKESGKAWCKPYEESKVYTVVTQEPEKAERVCWEVIKELNEVLNKYTVGAVYFESKAEFDNYVNVSRMVETEDNGYAIMALVKNRELHFVEEEWQQEYGVDSDVYWGLKSLKAILYISTYIDNDLCIEGNLLYDIDNLHSKGQVSKSKREKYLADVDGWYREIVAMQEGIGTKIDALEILNAEGEESKEAVAEYRWFKALEEVVDTLADDLDNIEILADYMNMDYSFISKVVSEYKQIDLSNSVKEAQ